MLTIVCLEWRLPADESARDDGSGQQDEAVDGEPPSLPASERYSSQTDRDDSISSPPPPHVYLAPSAHHAPASLWLSSVRDVKQEEVVAPDTSGLDSADESDTPGDEDNAHDDSQMDEPAASAAPQDSDDEVDDDNLAQKNAILDRMSRMGGLNPFGPHPTQIPKPTSRPEVEEARFGDDKMGVVHGLSSDLRRVISEGEDNARPPIPFSARRVPPVRRSAQDETQDGGHDHDPEPEGMAGASAEAESEEDFDLPVSPPPALHTGNSRRMVSNLVPIPVPPPRPAQTADESDAYEDEDTDAVEEQPTAPPRVSYDSDSISRPIVPPRTVPVEEPEESGVEADVEDVAPVVPQLEHRAHMRGPSVGTAAGTEPSEPVSPVDEYVQGVSHHLESAPEVHAHSGHLREKENEVLDEEEGGE
jgi:hypothetical protein